MVDPAPTRQEARIALRDYAKHFGDEAKVRLLNRMANVASVEKIPDSKLLDVINAAYEGRLFPKPKSIASSKKWKEVEKATKRGHAKVYGMKSGT